MKRIKQIAQETNNTSKEIYRIIIMLEIIPTKIKFQEIDTYQEELIHNYLYCCGKLEYLTFESKMNNPTFDDELFLEHKRNTYLKSV